MTKHDHFISLYKMFFLQCVADMCFHCKPCRVFPAHGKVLRQNKTHIPQLGAQVLPSLPLREKCLLFFPCRVMRLIFFSLIFIQTKHMVCVRTNTFHLECWICFPGRQKEKKHANLIFKGPGTPIRHDRHLFF